jgi:O-antigen/teichoic acid export membrane protein
MLLNTGSLVGTMLVTSFLGMAYWVVAGHLFSKSAIGLATTATSTMMFLSSVGLLGLSTLLISELQRNKGQEGTIISAAVILVTVVGIALGFLYAFGAPLIFPNLKPLGANFSIIAQFALGVGITSATSIVDVSMIALLRGELQFWRNAIFAVSKLLLLFVATLLLKFNTGISIYTVWTIANVISLFPICLYGLIKAQKTHRSLFPQWGIMRNMSSSAIQHHILNLILQTPTQVLPTIATILFSTAISAEFYDASMMANFVFAVLTSLTTVLHATNATQTTTLSQKSRMTTALSFGISTGAAIIFMLGASLALGIYGHDYTSAAWSLRFLALGAFPLIIKNHYIAISRIKDKVVSAIIPIAIGSTLELGMAVVGGMLGHLNGLSVGWVIGMTLEALIMTPTVYRTLRNTDAPVEIIGTIEGFDTQDDELDSMIEGTIHVSQKLMAIEPSTDTFRSIVIMDAPTVKLPVITTKLPVVSAKMPAVSAKASGKMPAVSTRSSGKIPAISTQPTSILEDDLAPTVKLRKLQPITNGTGNQYKNQENASDAPDLSVQVVEFLNSPTVKMQSIRMTPKVKKTPIEDIPTVAQPTVTGTQDAKTEILNKKSRHTIP